MLVAARTLALSTLELLEQPREIEAAKADFAKRKAGRSWVTRIAAGAKPPLDPMK
jgi:aminobenzoyl-glutamate utilization protein B